MSELDPTLLASLRDALVAAGLDADRARRLAALNATMPIVEGEEWIVVDQAGAEVLRLPTPKEIAF